jgi:hypothetical protein
MGGTCADQGPAENGTRAPRSWRRRGVQDRGNIAGSSQVPSGDRGSQDLGGVLAGEFGRAQGPPQPLLPRAGCGVVAGRQSLGEQVTVPLVPGGGGLGGPDRVQHREVVRVGPGLVPGLGG